MPRVTLTDVGHGAQLLKEVVRRADVNGDGVIRSGDLDRIREHTGLRPSNQTWNDGSDAAHVMVGLNAAVGRARVRGGPSLEVLDQAIDELEAKVRAANKDGNRTLSAAEQRSVRGTGERGFLDFVIWAKGKSLDDVDLPAQQEHRAPRFSWRGTPEQVCQSLLEATTKATNDTEWPAWQHGEGAAFYGVDGDEARAMVEKLRPLYANRQKAVLQVLASRTEASVYGCVGPNAEAKRILEDYAASLGLEITLGSPPPPRMPSPT